MAQVGQQQQQQLANDTPNLDAVHSALKAVRLLRCSVGDVFKSLADCPLVVNGANDKSSVTTGTTNTTTNAAAAADETDSVNSSIATQALTDLQTLLSAVNTRFRELETACTLISPPNASLMNTNSSLPALGNSSLLGQDPQYEKTNLYSDMISAYRWSDKMMEYSTIAATLLQQNSLRRSLTSLYMKNRPQRRPPNGHNINAQQIDLFINNLQRVLPDLGIEVVRPFGAPTVLKITIPRVLKAIILLRGLLIEWVVVKGFDESFEDSNYDNSYAKRLRRFPESTSGGAVVNLELERLDIWSESRYRVFRKVSEHANAAMLHYYSPTHCDVAIKTYLTWLKSYVNLFSAVCCKCNCHLQNYMPPTWRDIRTFSPYHEQCRP
ncbi:mediator of RNA polymerase II transcription subunit 27-like [Oppia nitens]|uniref:mediator of RNA polymerase II transcription subunit 27-like n=1 Tax=Oppia nitens TaxID=1686743 RepID=UPI0023DA41E7|nr:mediator of RNA polymerase II transcription subunit 27-like [Oppia nitens]